MFTSALKMFLNSSVVTAVTDAYFNLVTLLLPGNGTNGAQNNTFLDSSTNNFSITRNGNTTQGTFSPFSQTGWSNYFDGSSVLSNTTTTSTGFNLSTGSFTIEAWVYVTAITAYQYVVSLANTAGNDSGLVFGLDNTGKPYIGNGVVLGKSGSTSISANSWTHIAVVSDGTNIQFYTNGTANGSAQAFNPNTAQYFYVGRSAAGSNALTGYISNVRVTKGQQLYTGAFTPSTSALTTTSQGATANNVHLLTCQSNRFVDNGTNTFAITVTGTPSVQAFSPFAPTAAYSAATVGGSGYFDGTGDYLDTGIQSNLYLNSSDYTIEFWAYFLRAPGTANAGTLQAALTQGDGAYFGGVNDHNWYFLFEPTQLNFGKQPTPYAAAHTPTLNTWVHYAVVGNSSGSITVYVNGVSLGTQTGRTALGSASWSTRVGLGYYGDSKVANYFQGYMSSLRIVKGTQVYTGNFTPPIAPVGTSGPASSYSSTTNVNTTFTSANTQLLLNYTNAGITDATAKNDLETVGNAQISTTQSKFGGSSMLFDGTGDYLSATPKIQSNAVQGGNATIEMWVYTSNSSPSLKCLVDTRSAQNTDTGFGVYQISNNVVIYGAGVKGNAVGQLTGNTWVHVAVTRANTTNYVFIDGTLYNTFSYGNTLTSSNVTIGSDVAGSNAFTGYIDDLRITNGFARYTANFTPTTVAFPLQ